MKKTIAMMMALACAGVGAAETKGSNPAFKPMNILCVCAHPDDAEFSCGGTLLKYHKLGHKIFNSLGTGPDSIRSL